MVVTVGGRRWWLSFEGTRVGCIQQERNISCMLNSQTSICNDSENLLWQVPSFLMRFCTDDRCPVPAAPACNCNCKHKMQSLPLILQYPSISKNFLSDCTRNYLTLTTCLVEFLDAFLRHGGVFGQVVQVFLAEFASTFLFPFSLSLETPTHPAALIHSV